MKIISHRGNLTGRITDQENRPSYIQAAIDAGYEVEIDVWCVEEKFYLGHDEPQYFVEDSWLKDRISLLWCHAKNEQALHRMLQLGLHCFWHESDRFTLTSKAIPWCFPNNYQPNGVTVVFGYEINIRDVFGVCTDYPLSWTAKICLEDWISQHK